MADDAPPRPGATLGQRMAAARKARHAATERRRYARAAAGIELLDGIPIDGVGWRWLLVRKGYLANEDAPRKAVAEATAALMQDLIDEAVRGEPD